MTRTCPRCGFPSSGEARACRACKAPLDGGKTRLSPRLQQVLKKARHRNNPENQVDRLPGRLPSTQVIQARRQSLARERQSGLSQLRQRLQRMEGAPAAVGPQPPLVSRRPTRPPAKSVASAAPARRPELPAANAEVSARPALRVEPEPPARTATAPEVQPESLQPRPAEEVAAAPIAPTPVLVAAVPAKPPEESPSPVLEAEAPEAEEAADETPLAVVAASTDSAFSKEETQSDEDELEAFLRAREVAVESEAAFDRIEEKSSAAEAVPVLPAEPVDDFLSDEPFYSQLDLLEPEGATIEQPSLEEAEASLEVEVAVQAAGEMPSSALELEAQPAPGLLTHGDAVGVPLRLVEAALEAQEDPSHEQRMGRFGWRRLTASLVDLVLPVGIGILCLPRSPSAILPPEEVIARLMLGDGSGLALAVTLVASAWSLLVGLSCWKIGRSPGMWLLGMAWQGASLPRLLLRLPLTLLGILPLCLGVTWAWVDSNGCTLADRLLGLRWVYRDRQAL